MPARPAAEIWIRTRSQLRAVRSNTGTSHYAAEIRTHRTLSNWFADRLLEVARSDEKRLWADRVVPVPLHRQRKKERGYSQVELFAKPLAKRLSIPYRPVLLMRTRPRPEKHLLEYEERWESYVALLR